MGDRIMLLGAGFEALQRMFPALTREVGDATLVAIRSALASRRETSACASWKDNELNRALDAVAHHRSFNPLVEWLRSLKWDGVERIDRWLVDYCGSPDTPLVRAVGSLFLRGAVARAFMPSVKFDYLTILESPQGYLKSSMIGVLGGEFAREGLRDLRSKDVIDDLRGAWIVELEELQVTRREDVQTLKAFLSRTVDRARLAYGHRSQTYLRRFVFIGTTNDATYLRDDTGNRRFQPVEVTREIDLDGVRRDREQLFAEAVVRWLADPRAESLVLPRYLWSAAAEEQERRRVADPWEEGIEEWVDQPEQAARPGFQANEILRDAIGKPLAQQTKHDRERVGAVMRRLGWKHKPFRDSAHGGKVRKGYVRPDCTVGEITLRSRLAKLDGEGQGMLQ
jgi:predicted P-loop ATPase